MYLFGTHRSITQRLRLSMDRELGAGNFFWRTCAVAHDLDRPVLFRTAPDGLTGLSLRELRERVLRYANWYLVHDVGHGTRVGVYTSDGLLALLHHIAITSLGGVTVLANPNLDPAAAADYFRHTDTALVLGDTVRLTALTAAADNAGTEPLGTADIDTVEREATSAEDLGEHRHHHRRDDLVLVSHSSGTTGMPKPTLFAHHTFSVGKRERLWNFPSATTDRILTALPHSHSAGISYLSLTMLLGLPTLMIDDPSGTAVAAAMNTFTPTVVIAFPLSLADLEVETLSARASTSVHTWMGMGDASHERHIRPLVAIGPAAGSTYVDGLGSSEMGMVLFKHAYTRESTRYGRTIGKPVKVVSQAAVLDELGNELPDGQSGLLGVRTPSITPGYDNDPGLTAQARVGGYFLTGDVVRRDAEGVWYHLDRTPDAIRTVAGTAYSLPMEEVVLNETGAFDAAVVAVDDPFADGWSRPIVVVLFKDGGPAPQDVLARCNRVLAHAGMTPLAAAVVAETRADLPVGVTGKVLKRVLRDRHRRLLGGPTPAGTAIDVRLATSTTK